MCLGGQGCVCFWWGVGSIWTTELTFLKQRDESLLKRTQHQRGFFREAYPRWVSIHVVTAVHSSPKPIQMVGQYRTRRREGQLEGYLVSQHSVAKDVLPTNQFLKMKERKHSTNSCTPHPQNALFLIRRIWISSDVQYTKLSDKQRRPWKN